MCTRHIFGEPSLLSNIRRCASVTFRGLGGKVTVDRVGTHESWGDVFLRPDASSVNLLSLAVLESEPGTVVKYEQATGCFLVTGKDGVTYEFSRGGGKLYTCDLADEMSDATASVSRTD
jgi:hypothetical protein